MGRFCGVHFSLVIHQVVNIVISQRSENKAIIWEGSVVFTLVWLYIKW